MSSIDVCPKTNCTEPLRAARLDFSIVTRYGQGQSKSTTTEYRDYDTYSNVGRIDERDFSGNLARRTEIQYETNSALIDEWIVDRPKQTTISKPSGEIVSEFKTFYYFTNNSGGALGEPARTEAFADKTSAFTSGDDWLATDFIASGWSMKHLHRTIVTSNAYQQRLPARWSTGRGGR